MVLLEQRPEIATEARVRIRLAALSGVTRREEEGIESAKRADLQISSKLLLLSKPK